MPYKTEITFDFVCCVWADFLYIPDFFYLSSPIYQKKSTAIDKLLTYLFLMNKIRRGRDAENTHFAKCWAFFSGNYMTTTYIFLSLIGIVQYPEDTA
jgi:hypothetical protein